MIEIDNAGVDEIKKLDELMQKVKDENSLIEKFFEKIETFKNGILAQNKEIIRNLEIH